MRLSEALTMWLGPPEAPDAGSRCVFLGAGFTKACNGHAPLFRDYVPVLCEHLGAAPATALAPELRATLVGPRGLETDPSDLVELYDQVFGRRAVVELLLAEPPPSAIPLRAFTSCAVGGAPPAASADSTYRTFEQWRSLVGEHLPAHLALLRPANPAILLARLVAECAVPLVLSTNWDAYVEVACWLVGLTVRNVEDVEPTSDEGARLVVYDQAQDVALRSRPRGHPFLLKLHGGVGAVARILAQAARGVLSAAEVDRRLAESFLVATSDLTHWRDASQWVHDAVSDVLRTHRILLLGASGADPVTFRAVRARIAEWERHANGSPRVPTPGPVVPHAGLAAVDRSPGARLYGMMAVRGRGVPAFPVAQAEGRHALRAAYAWMLAQKMAAALASTPGDERWRDRLVARLAHEVDGGGPTPLIDVLCDALGPNARWAAIAEGRPPLDGAELRAEHRWRYAPWSTRGDGGAPPAALRQVAACAVRMSGGLDEESARHGVEVDEWTGVVHLGDGHPLAEQLRHSSLLPLPWPWPARRGMASLALRAALRDRFGWGAGRTHGYVGGPLLLIPIGGVDAGAQPRRTTIGGRDVDVKAVDWFEPAA